MQQGTESEFFSDTPSSTPPPDRLISSAGRTSSGLDVLNYTDQELMAAHGMVWPTICVTPGSVFNATWVYTQPYRTRGYRWYITRDGWQKNQRLTRADFETGPLYSDFNPYKPFWDFTVAQMPPSEHHDVMLPMNKSGHHVILLVWIIADEYVGYYQTFDVDFH